MEINIDNMKILLQENVDKAPKVERPAAMRFAEVTDIILNNSEKQAAIMKDEFVSVEHIMLALIEKATLESSEIERDITPLQDVLKMDLIPTYEAMSEEDKRRFWRAIIKEIHVDGNEVKSVVFL
jgi:ATP-dependent Clp protease ATP-binding subunit ClpA